MLECILFKSQHAHVLLTCMAMFRRHFGLCGDFLKVWTLKSADVGEPK